MDGTLLSSLMPSIAGVVIAHPLLTLKTNLQVIGGKPSGLYAGMGLYITKAVPANTITFMLLQTQFFQDWSPWAKGAMTRLIAETMVYPLNLWSVEKQVGLKPSGYFRGLAPTIARDIVFSALFVQIHHGWLAETSISLPMRLICAATGASIITQPLDWYKIRSQLGMPMNGLTSGLLYRLAYCNVRSVIAWGLFETARKRS